MYMPILHFNGEFSFQPPFYNNNPSNDAREADPIDLDHPREDDPMHSVKFDSSLSQDQLQKRMGCDPLKYFDFAFSNVSVSRITYDDGTSTDKDDLIIGKPILLRGLLVDVDPHLERGQLFAAEVRVVDTLIGQLNKAVQSELHTSIRIAGGGGGFFNLSAHIETELYNVYHLADPKITGKNSRCIRELLLGLSDLKLEIHFRIDRYNINTNKGDVYGYISPAISDTYENGILVKNRHLIIDSKVDEQVKKDFHVDDENDRLMHLEASYDIMKDSGIILLRYLDFIPFIDNDYHTPAGYRYYLIISKKDKSDVAKKDIIVHTVLDSTHEEMKKSGGLVVIKLTSKINDFSNLNLSVKVAKNEVDPQPFLSESKWNLILPKSERHMNTASGSRIVLKDSQECMTIGSNRQKGIDVTIFYNHQLCPDGTEIDLTSPKEDDLSPIVAWFTKGSVSTVNGRIRATIQTRNLEDSEEVRDPLSDSENKMIRGNLPWDRYYGNKLTLTIKGEDEHLFSRLINIPVRVLHVVDEKKIPANINFARDIMPLFSYYLRYYPWLHIDVQSCRYNQFLNLSDAESIAESIAEILARLKLDDNDWHKMPRSRDFPLGGVRLLERKYGSEL
jgi:hypothetical protein